MKSFRLFESSIKNRYTTVNLTKVRFFEKCEFSNILKKKKNKLTFVKNKAQQILNDWRMKFYWEREKYSFRRRRNKKIALQGFE